LCAIRARMPIARATLTAVEFSLLGEGKVSRAAFEV